MQLLPLHRVVAGEEVGMEPAGERGVGRQRRQRLGQAARQAGDAEPAMLGFVQGTPIRGALSDFDKLTS